MVLSCHSNDVDVFSSVLHCAFGGFPFHLPIRLQNTRGREEERSPEMTCLGASSPTSICSRNNFSASGCCFTSVMVPTRMFSMSGVAGAAAAAVCYGFLKVVLPEAATNQYEIKWVRRYRALFWTCRAGVRLYLGSSFSFFFSFDSLFAYTKTHTIFFRFIQ